MHADDEPMPRPPASVRGKGGAVAERNALWTDEDLVRLHGHLLEKSLHDLFDARISAATRCEILAWLRAPQERSGPSRTARAALCLASTPTRSASGCWRVIGIVFQIDQPIAARRPSRVREPPVAPGTPARPGSSSRGIFLPPSAAGSRDWRHSLASGRPRGSTVVGTRVPGPPWLSRCAAARRDRCRCR
jgi:hypothetical protein